MKKGRKVLGVLVGVLIALMLVGSVSAADPAYVFGTIIDEETGAPVPDAAVIVTCDNGNTATATSASVDPDPGIGHYDTGMPPSFDCPVGSGVIVYAEKDGKSGTNNTGTINPSGMVGIEVGVALVDVPIAAPEAIVAVAIITALAPALAYGVVRRRRKK